LRLSECLAVIRIPVVEVEEIDDIDLTVFHRFAELLSNVLRRTLPVGDVPLVVTDSRLVKVARRG
jgi:hypothetical protein